MRRLVFCIVIHITLALSLVPFSTTASAIDPLLGLSLKGLEESKASKRQRCKLVTLFRDMWKESWFGAKSESVETATWISLDGDGNYVFHAWPRTPERQINHWQGQLPANSIALAHTHPRSADPRPSTQDRTVAAEVKMNLYTISNKGIGKVIPTGTMTQEADRYWYEQLVNDACK